MLDLASTLGDLPEKRGQAPWPEYEYVKGWGVFGLPFDSGHVLALRVFPQLRLLNAAGAHLPVWTWKPRAFVRAREWTAHRLGMGDLEMSGTMPSGHFGTLMPQRIFFVEEAIATLGGADLGRPIHAKPNPMIGEVPLPARGILAIGQAMWRILDPVEYERTRNETADLASRGGVGPSERGP